MEGLNIHLTTISLLFFVCHLPNKLVTEKKNKSMKDLSQLSHYYLNEVRRQHWWPLEIKDEEEAEKRELLREEWGQPCSGKEEALKSAVAKTIAEDFVRAAPCCSHPGDKKGIAFVYGWHYYENPAYCFNTRLAPLASDEFMSRHACDICRQVEAQLPPIKNHISHEPLWRAFVDGSHTGFTQKNTAIVIVIDFTAYRKHLQK